MANWIMAAARDWLIPVVDRMHEHLLRGRYLYADETTVQVMNEEGRKNTTGSYMWVYSTGQHSKNQIRIFEYQPGRSGKYPWEFLKGFKAYLHTDAYAGYGKVPDITRCMCWSHVRRKFVDSLPKDIRGPDATIRGRGIKFCNKLFDIEDELVLLSMKIVQKRRRKLNRSKSIKNIEINRGQKKGISFGRNLIPLLIFKKLYLYRCYLFELP